MAGKTYQCNFCDKIFPSFEGLSIHSRIHTGERPFSCDVCGKGFTTGGNLNVHKITHSEVKHFQCNVCKKRFSNKQYLQVHQRIHTGSKPYKCTHCSKRFSDPSAFRGHKKLHLRVTPFQREIYETPVERQGSLTAHQQIDTSANRNVECEECQKPIYPEPIPVPNSREYSYSCKLCEKRFQDMCLLHSHMNLHLGPLADKCTECADLILAKLQKLNEACEATECLFCEMKFSQRDLEKHMRSHTGE